MIYNHTRASWQTAVGLCAQKQGHLASMETDEEFNVIAGILRPFFADQANVNQRNYGVWVDGTDKVVEGNWYCAFRKGTCAYLSWGPGFLRINYSHNCIRMYQYSDSASDFGFTDGVLCHYVTYGSFVCEFECHD